jgi:ABC-type bacteriocin/lantibiotic exporters, contain an N-terminal double-glycine peptidase domain
MVKNNIHPILSRLKWSRRKAIPVIIQNAATDCGPVCLAMVLSYFGKPISTEKTRDLLSFDSGGVGATDLIRVGQLHGLQGRMVRIDIDSLSILPKSTILHWDFCHFVVFERFGKDYVQLIDPRVGRRRVRIDEARKLLTGVAILFEPNPTFRTGPRLSSPLWAVLKNAISTTPILGPVLITSFCLQMLGLSVPMLTAQLIDRVIPYGDGSLLLVLLLALGIMVSLYFAAMLIRGNLLLQIRARLDGQLSHAFLQHLLGLPYSYFLLRQPGDLMQRIQGIAVIREVITASMLSALLDGFLVIGYLLLVMFASFQMGFTLVIIGILNALIFLLSYRTQRELAATSLLIESRVRVYESELMNSAIAVKSMGAEAAAIDHWSKLFSDGLNAMLNRGRLTVITDALTATVRIGSPIAILAVGTNEVFNGHMSVGSMLGTAAVAAGFLLPLTNLTTSALQLQTLSAYLDRLRDVFLSNLEQNPEHELQRVILSGRIVLKDVTFSFNERQTPVLKNISLDIHSGQFVAIVGRSGAGKSTLANLILGLHPVSSGQILFDDKELSQIDLSHLRTQIGIVPQRNEVFGGTIRENIAFSDPTRPLSEIIEAARTAQIHDEIEKLPLGYSTPLVTRDASLSGGQRQRILIARALLRKPSILVLDEATSALDSITELRVHNAISQLGCTRIVIAHRLTTVEQADHIIVLKDGLIVDQGCHKDLLARDGEYRDLIQSKVRSIDAY